MTTKTNLGRNGKRFGSNIPSSAGAFVIDIPPTVKICHDFFIIICMHQGDEGQA